jgi:type IV secretion system protein VirD4
MTRWRLSAAVFIAAFTVSASLLLLWSTGKIGHFNYPYYQWWYYAGQQPGNFYVLLSGGVSAACITILWIWLTYQLRRVRGWSLRSAWPVNRRQAAPIRSRTSIYGSARWQTPAESSRRWSGPVSPNGGIVVGEDRFTPDDCGPFIPNDPATWGRRGKLLIDPLLDGPPNCIVVAGTGGYKSSCIVPTGCTWTGGAVFHDPSGELVSILYETRRAMGHEVYILSTEDHIERQGGGTPIPAAAFNVLDWIDTTSNSAELDVSAVIEWVCGTIPARASESSKFFGGRAKDLVRCLLADLLWNPNCDPELKTLETLRDLIATSGKEIRKGLQKIHDHSASRLARNIAGTFDDAPEETFGSILQSADAQTAWLAIEANARLVSGHSFRSADLIGGKTDVFLSLPMKVLQSSPALARCIVAALINQLYEAGNKVNGKILFVLDEARWLGYLGSLKIARDTARRHGIAMVLAYQSEEQITDQWGPTGKSEWFSTVRWRSYSAITDPQTAETLSKTCDEYGAVDWSESVRRWRGAFGRPQPQLTYNTRAVRLIRPGEIVTQRTDTQIVVGSPGHHPAKLGRAIYWRDKRFLAQVGSNPFAGQHKP